MLLFLLFMVGANAHAHRQDSLRHTGNREAEATATSAVKFKVTGFKVLPNDVSAFITPVRDLNNEACALLKVVAQQDFAFSSPLGIVKRKDEVGARDCQAQGRSGRNMALPAQRDKTDNHQAPAMGRVEKL